MEEEFEGKSVVSTQLIVTGTGDGLSKAVQVKPTTIHHGDEVYLLIKAVGQKVRFDPHKDDPEELVRVQILRAETVAIVSAEFAGESIAAQRLAEEAAKGVQRLPFEDAVDGAINGSGGDVLVDDGGVILTDSEVEERRGASIAEEKAAAKWFGQPDAIPDLPTADDLQVMEGSTIKAALEMVGSVCGIDGVPLLRRLIVAEKQTHNGVGRKSVLAALAKRIADLEFGGDE